MKKYTVIVDRITYTPWEVCVMAENEKEACKEAYRLSGDIDFSGKVSTYDYETTVVEEESP
jgi:hypothetical protein